MSNTNVQGKENSIPLGRRIGEIMEDKGAAFSIRAFSQRLGLSKDTLSRMISGDRPIKPSELDKIAEYLKISIDRIKQSDVFSIVNELDQLLSSYGDLNKAVCLAEKFNDLALGITEKYEAVNYLGQVYFELRQYDISHQYRLKAYSLALQIQEKYDESERLYQILEKLMTSFTVKMDYSSAYKIVQQVEPILTDNSKGMGTICYTLAMIAYSIGNYEETRNRLYQSLEYYERTGANVFRN